MTPGRGIGGGWVGVGLISLIGLIGRVIGLWMAHAVTFGVKTVKVACDVGVLRYCIVGVTMMIVVVSLQCKARMTATFCATAKSSSHKAYAAPLLRRGQAKETLDIVEKREITG